MNQENFADIRNKLTAPKTALEKLAKGEQVPREFLELAVKELTALDGLLKQLELSDKDHSKSPQKTSFSI